MLNREWFYKRPAAEDHHEEEEERKVGWLELFYDLIFVATLIQLGNLLSHDVSVQGFVEFIALFIPIWLAWTGIMFYANRFPIDDFLHRLLIFVQMAGLTVMAISVDHVFGEGELFNQFVLAYVAVRLILVLLYARAYAAVPEARQLALGFGAGFFAGAAVWFLSIFMPEPLNYLMWAVGVVVELVIPLTPPVVKWQRVFPPHREHLVERYGIFTIIVLGESFVKTTDQLAGTAVDLPLALVGIGGMVVLFGLWWLYFDDVHGAHVAPGARSGPYVWIYSHLPIAIGVTAFGVGVKKLVDAPAGDPLADKYRLLVCTALIIFLVFLALVDRVTARHDSGTMPNPARSIWRFGGAALLLILALFGGSLTPGVLAAAGAVIFLGQIAANHLLARSAAA